ncbi:DUF4270 family protein [Carboxylicivirga sp. RSCT41]|uniref:DUF4270 family protein n=1 Tax=Carboxylicivirga agarovorans TaxID=3417570 RepID=UPI003D33EA0F
MKNYSLNKIFLSAGQLFMIGLLSLTVSCKDEPARITGDVLPEGEMIKGHYYDGHILNTQNISRTKDGGNVRTDDATYGIIGTFEDPVFGPTKADFVTDFSIGRRVFFDIDSIYGLSLTTGNDTVYKNDDKGFQYYQFDNNNGDPRFPYDEWILDSLVLNMQYQFNNWYGDMLSEQNIKVYELTTPLGLAGVDQYYNDHEMKGLYNPIAIGEAVVHPNNEVPDSLKNADVWGDGLWDNPVDLWSDPSYLWDVAKVDTVMDNSFNGHTTQIKNWSIKLDEDRAREFFELDENTLSSTAAFKSFFNGLYITADIASNETGTGSLTKINLLSGDNVATNLSMHISRKYKYWKKQEDNTYEIIDSTVKQIPYSFPINLENVRFNRYSHDLNDAIKLDDPSTDKLYIQGMAGSYMRLQLPEEVLTWVDSIGNPAQAEPFNAIDYHMVSNVEFYMEAAMDSADVARYPIPGRLTIKWPNDKGELVDPIYQIVVNGNEVSVPVFGTTDSQGNSVGSGERVSRLNENGDIEYLYRFIMRADYFNYIMRYEDGAGLDEKEFFIGPENTTANFQRVILYSGSEDNEQVSKGGENVDKRMKMNVKYYQYRPR